MKQKAILTLTTVIGLALALGVFTGLTLARDGIWAPVDDTGPTVISYQGEVLVDGEPYTGTGYFKFAVVNALENYTFWSNDGTSVNGAEPTSAVDLSVADGVFSVLLGNPLENNMTEPLAADVFADRGRRLHIWFSSDVGGPFTDLGTTLVAAVPYALNAETLDGMDGSYYDQHYDNLIVVAKSGGDYTSIQAAVDSITDNDEFNRYLVWVAPGAYSEIVTLKPYVSLQGAGTGTTVLISTASGGTAASGATLTMAEYTSLRDMTVVVTGTGTVKAAIYMSDIPSDTVMIADAAILASGGATTYGVYNSHASPLIMDTSITAEGTGEGTGIFNHYSEATIWNVIVHGQGDDGYGIRNTEFVGDGPTIRDTIVTGRGDADDGYGIYNNQAVNTIRGSVVSGEGVDKGRGVHSFTDGQTYTTTIDSCQLSGSGFASGFALSATNLTTVINVGSSLLDGGVGSTAIVHCVFAYDETYTALDGNCQPIP